jgi:hypothetical protein
MKPSIPTLKRRLDGGVNERGNDDLEATEDAGRMSSVIFEGENALKKWSNAFLEWMGGTQLTARRSSRMLASIERKAASRKTGGAKSGGVLVARRVERARNKSKKI